MIDQTNKPETRISLGTYGTAAKDDFVSGQA